MALPQLYATWRDAKRAEEEVRRSQEATARESQLQLQQLLAAAQQGGATRLLLPAGAPGVPSGTLYQVSLDPAAQATTVTTDTSTASPWPELTGGGLDQTFLSPPIPLTPPSTTWMWPPQWTKEFFTLPEFPAPEPVPESATIRLLQGELQSLRRTFELCLRTMERISAQLQGLAGAVEPPATATPPESGRRRIVLDEEDAA